jgi:hypothetical protein
MQSAAILPFAASLPPSYFSTLSHKSHDFLNEAIEHKMFILIFLTTLKGIQQDIFTNVKTFSCKVLFITVPF